MIIRPALLYRSPLNRELYKSLLIRLQPFENRLLRTIAMNTFLQRSRKRHIRNTWNISTVKGYITQNYIQFYDTIIFDHTTTDPHYLARIIDITTTNRSSSPVKNHYTKAFPKIWSTHSIFTLHNIYTARV
jgi:hypothetical protein